MPRRKHAEQPRFAYDIAVEIRDGEPDGILRSVVYRDAGFHRFFIGRFFKAALEHDLRLTEPVGEKRRIFFPLLAQNNPVSSDDFVHAVSQSLPLRANSAIRLNPVNSIAHKTAGRERSLRNLLLEFPASGSCTAGEKEKPSVSCETNGFLGADEGT